MPYDLLDEPILSWRDTHRVRDRTTLPGVLAKLASGELGDFPRVQAHQFHPWCMFLTQLAAIALHRSACTDVRVSEGDWRQMLLTLTGDAHEPWCLITDQLSLPALLQPPIPEASKGWELLDEWHSVARPDELDILVTSKAHDVKEARLERANPEFWVYSLATLQTMQGYPGRGYNPISRMKGGYGNRPRVGLTPGSSPADRFARDVGVLLESWPHLLERGFNDSGVALVWTEPWDGAASLDLKDLAPHFIEVCWRVRCFDGDGIRCAYTTTKQRRCLPSIANGDVGDPWIPVERDGGALTVGRRGFHCELLTHILFGDDYEPAAAQIPRTGDGDPVVLEAFALARGQGKTEGLHERSLVLPGEVRRRLGKAEERTALGRRALTHLDRAKKMRSNVLFPALKSLALGETIVRDSFDARVDEDFFQVLFRTLDREDHESQVEWDSCLIEMAARELDQAIARCALADAQWHRRVAEAEAMFRGCLRKIFPDALAQRTSSRGPVEGGDHP